jgi:hypothetical protein
MSSQRLRKIDSRPPVLLLRSFRNDNLVVKIPREFSRLAAFNPYSRGESITLEELVLATYAPLGPLVTIADPQTTSRPFGAARERVGDGDWQNRVIELIAESSRIVVIVDNTENLLWEIEQLMRGDYLTKTLFVFPPVQQTVLDADLWYPRPIETADSATVGVDVQEALRALLFENRPDPFQHLPPNSGPTALAVSNGSPMIVASKTGTLADHTISIRLAEEFISSDDSEEPKVFHAATR